MSRYISKNKKLLNIFNQSDPALIPDKRDSLPNNSYYTIYDPSLNQKINIWKPFEGQYISEIKMSRIHKRGNYKPYMIRNEKKKNSIRKRNYEKSKDILKFLLYKRVEEVIGPDNKKIEEGDDHLYGKNDQKNIEIDFLPSKKDIKNLSSGIKINLIKGLPKSIDHMYNYHFLGKRQP